ncbi:VirK family antimicrobial peptide resistance protein [Campylobacter sp. LH-2024]|uniref:VirK family antimicrobial peptide resistance protein n=1 Tax=Campylobacter TaxID=194 RepID=UPI00301D9A29|nr:VirK family antimicrobial peptide resistance protein [Campylobacter sp. RM10543]MBZ7951116.1 VirK family antimicrobial peptide resistance protein [Campylobacter sp. W0046]
MNQNFTYPTPNFSDPKKSIIFWRYSRFWARKILYFSQVNFFIKTLNKEKNNHLKYFFQEKPYACYNVIRRFCDKSFSANDRVKTLLYDVDKGLKTFTFFPERKNIFILKDEENTFEIDLDQNYHVCEEGFWAIKLKFNTQVILQASFCFTLENNILIACIQGYKHENLDSLKINKICTKKFFGLRPTDLIIECIKILTKILNCNVTLGVYEKNQIRSQKKQNKGYYVNYQKIWLENAGELIKINKRNYYKLSHLRKKIEEISSQKRSMYKKRFAILDEIEKKINEIFSK